MNSSARKSFSYPLETQVPCEIYECALSKPDNIPSILDLLEKDTSRRKFAYEKAIRLISEEHPEILYPHFERISYLIGCKNSFIRWGAIMTLSNMAVIDSEKKSLQVIDAYLGMLDSENMIDASNAAGNLWKFIVRFPELDDKVTSALLHKSAHTFFYKGEPSQECGYIVMGNVLSCFAKYFDISNHKHEILGFAKKALSCPRIAVAKKAAKFVKEHIV